MPKTITQFQAFLILLQLNIWPQAERDELQKLSLSGIRDDRTNEQVVDEINRHQALSPYAVSLEPNAITNDPARRYFETTLAYYTLQNKLDALPLVLLQQLVTYIAGKLSGDSRAEIAQLLSSHPDKIQDPDKKQYADAIFKIQHAPCFAQWSDAKKEKMTLLMNLCLHCLFSSHENDRWLPLNIYDRGLFSVKNRGKELLSDQESTRNSNYGLLKGHMPIPKNDICFSGAVSDFVKPSDQSTFDPRALWLQHAFSKRVHPHSNSISGTMLCLLKHLAQHKKVYNKKSPIYDPRFLGSLIQLIIALRLFIHGGHSLLEYTAVLNVPEVKNEFFDVAGFARINLENLFYTENKAAFQRALKATIDYNETLLKRRAVHDEITAHGNEVSQKIDGFISNPQYQHQLTELKDFIKVIVAETKEGGKKVFENVLEKLEHHELSAAKELIAQFKNASGSAGFFKGPGTFKFLMTNIDNQLDDLLNFKPSADSAPAPQDVTQNTRSHHSRSCQFH